MTKKGKNRHVRAMEWHIKEGEFLGRFGFGSHDEGRDDGDGTSLQDNRSSFVKKAKSKAPPSFLVHF